MDAPLSAIIGAPPSGGRIRARDANLRLARIGDVADPGVIRIPWRPIEGLSPQDRAGNGSFGALDALRDEWERRLDALTEEERARIRQRSLRRLAVETGIIERLYDVEWGLTKTLVAEGFTRDVVERAG